MLKRYLLFLLILITACVPRPVADLSTPTPATPDPTLTAQTFLEAWQINDYAGMYSLLSPLSHDAVSLEEFSARYESVARQAALQAVETRLLAVEKNGFTAHVQYSVVLHTSIVGDIARDTEMQLVYASSRWTVAWADAMILPELAGGNTLHMELQIPARANIYDRSGLGLAVQGEAVAVGVQPGLITDEGAVLNALSALLGLTPEAIQQKYANARPDWYVPIGEASAADVQASLGALSALSGVILSPYTTRYYPLGGIAPHVVGYLSAIPPEKVGDYQRKGYQPDERVGAAGLEAWGEPYLAGARGGRLTVVTPTGQVAAVLAESQPQPAQALYTTLDRNLQIAAQQGLGDFIGTVIVMDPASGGILALASNPQFDPNLFDPTNRNSEALQAVLDNPAKPLFNRATQGLYPPGSVFKVPMMAAALMSGLYRPESHYTCTGVWDLLGPSAIKYDWTVTFGVPPHGTINLVQGLAFSCDAYFYTIAFDLYQYNADYMSQVARQFGLGEYTQVGQVAEAQGLIPDPEWKQAAYGEPWTPGDSVNMGIGQGFVLVTPLQIAEMMAAVRNGGTLYRPQVVGRIAPPGGGATYQLEPIINGKLPTTAEQLAVIKEGLHAVTSVQHGTAYHRFLNIGLPVAGKTGTAEDPASGGEPHAWFAGYTEADRADKPDIVIVVLVENKGEGSEWAAPIFRRIVETYFYGGKQTLYPWEAEFGVNATPTP